jgi:N4-gp56 family major capsid protein
MAGQIWSTDALGGYMYSDNLSKYLRTAMQPMQRFRNLCDAVDGTEMELNHGDTFTWNHHSDLARQGRRLEETRPIPETNATISQSSLTVWEAGNSVPFTGLLQNLGQQDVESLIDKQLRDDARKYFDIEAFLQFDRTPLRVAPTGGTSTTAVTLTTNSATGTTNNVALGTGHIKAISDLMRERNMPGFDGDDYVALSHPTTYRSFKNELEDIYQYTDNGLNKIFRGEIGRYEGIRFVTQNHIPKGGANDTTTFNAWTGTADAWNNNLSSWVYFIGRDTCAEAVLIPEEIRGKLPGDYGRDKGIAWYYLGGFGLIHTAEAQARIVKWDSAA